MANSTGAHHFKQSQGPHMTRRRKIYEGKAKILYEGPEPGTLIQYFKDDATAFNAQKKGTISGKGVINNRVSEHVFTRLSHIGIPTHFIRRLNMREQLIRQVEIVPIEVIVRNVTIKVTLYGLCTQSRLDNEKLIAQRRAEQLS
jgi:phosphoribosylaminoimidazole-succinocarboxamide synthase